MGGGAAADVAEGGRRPRHPDGEGAKAGEGVVLGGGVQKYAPLQAKSWETEVWGTGPLLPRF